jgi:putative membrane protein
VTDDTPRKRGPVLIELDAPAAAEPGPAPKQESRDQAQPNPADAPPIDEAELQLPRPRTMELVTRLVGRPPSRLTRFFLNAGVALFTFVLSVAALDFINNLLNRHPLLGWVGIALFGLFTLAALGMAWREYRAWARFARIDAMQREAGAALTEDSMDKARHVTDGLLALYHRRPELEWNRKRLSDHRAEAFDARTLLTMAETDLLAPLDQEARREIEAAARTVAAATALIPLALADVAAALAANLRMIRRMAEIYGGRAGAVGGWRLARTVMTHLIATGAVAAGDDLIHTVAGGSVLAKVSRRFGEGVVNGALTARVGIAAMEVCRPLPFMAQPRPKVTNLLTRGLRGLFGEGRKA